MSQIDKLFSKLKGGAGSGNFGHSGRPGKRGGSTSSSSSPAGAPTPEAKVFRNRRGQMHAQKGSGKRKIENDLKKGIGLRTIKSSRENGQHAVQISSKPGGKEVTVKAFWVTADKGWQTSYEKNYGDDVKTAASEAEAFLYQ